MPVSVASVMTSVKTWPRVAPRARSRASSWVLWATRMLKVLAIRKLPTKTAMKANTSSGVPMNSLITVTAFCSVCEAACAPVWTWTEVPLRAEATRSRSWRSVTPDWALTSMTSKVPLASRRLSAVGRVKRAKPSVAMLLWPPRVAMPLITKFWAAEASKLTWICCPTTRWPSVAVRALMTTSSGA